MQLKCNRRSDKKTSLLPSPKDQRNKFRGPCNKIHKEIDQMPKVARQTSSSGVYHVILRGVIDKTCFMITDRRDMFLDGPINDLFFLAEY